MAAQLRVSEPIRFCLTKEREGLREREEIPVNPIQDNQDPQEYKVSWSLPSFIHNVKQYVLFTKFK